MEKLLSVEIAGWLYSFIHFSVEVACFFFIYSQFGNSPLWWGIALLFDAMAFIPQSFIGIIVDKYPLLKSGPIGLLLILISLFVPYDYIALCILCLGNSMVHIAGAQKTLCSSNGKIAPCSIFVGGGSFGVVVGWLLGLANIKNAVVIPVVFIAISILFTILVDTRKILKYSADGFHIVSEQSPETITALAFVVVASRAYIGYAIPTDWNKTKLQLVFLFVAMGLGKIFGGILADKIGYRKTTIISLLGGMPFLLFGNSVMWLSLIGVGLFSMTMSLTVAVLVSVFPKQPCFAFGITTVALFAGTLPSFFIKPDTLLQHQITVVILCLIAVFSLLKCIRKGQ